LPSTKVDAFITKPVKPAVFVKTISNVLHH